MYKFMITGLFAAIFLLASADATQAGESGSLELKIASPDELVNSELLPSLEGRVVREAKAWHIKSWLSLVCDAPVGAEECVECHSAKAILAHRARKLMCCLVAWLPDNLTSQNGV